MTAAEWRVCSTVSARVSVSGCMFVGECVRAFKVQLDYFKTGENEHMLVFEEFVPGSGRTHGTLAH